MSTLVACSGAEARMLAQPVIDTLSGGAVRTMSPGPTGWEGTEGWQVELAQEITGTEGTPSDLVNPQSLAVDDWGRIFVADEKPKVIKVYGADGEFVRTIGRDGAGPGEFRQAFLALYQGFLVVHDPQVARTSVFDTAGTFLRSWPSSCCFWSDIQVDQAGRIHVPTVIQNSGAEGRPGTPYVRWTLDGTVVDTLWVPFGTGQARSWPVTTSEGGRSVMRMMVSVPLTPRLVSGYNPDGGFLVGWSEDYQIAVAPGGADTTAVFGRTWSPRPVPPERKEREIVQVIARIGDDFEESHLRQTFKAEDIPDQAPVFTGISVDRSGHRWVRLDPGLDTTRSLFDVFSPAGVLLGSVVIAPAAPQYGRMAFGPDQVVVARENAEGMPVVARYRVRR